MLGDVLVEGLALSLGNLELESGRLAGTVGTLIVVLVDEARLIHAIDKGMVAYSESTGTPGAATVDLVEVGQLAEDGLVAERDVDETVVSEGAHGRKSSGLLTTTLGTGGDEETGILAPVATGSPDSTGLVPESLPLGREVTVTGGDTEENSIILEQSLGLDDGVAGLGRSVHLSQDLLRKRLSDPR